MSPASLPVLISVCLPAGNGPHGMGLLPQQHSTPSHARGVSLGFPCVSLMVRVSLMVLSCQGSISFIYLLLLPQDKAILQVLERPPTATNMALDFLGSPVQRGYVGSPRHKRPDFRGMSPKSFPQHFLQQVQVFRNSCFALPLPSLLPEAVPSSEMLLCSMGPTTRLGFVAVPG